MVVRTASAYTTFHGRCGWLHPVHTYSIDFYVRPGDGIYIATNTYKQGSETGEFLAILKVNSLGLGSITIIWHTVVY